MIEKLIIKNFQSHNDSELNFDEGVNTIIGTSDHGKSSIFRALNLICNNKPDGNHFVSHWLINEKGKPTGNTECILIVDDNTIERIKGKTNEYKLNGDILKAFQRDVPEEISKLLNLDKANIQHQSDNFFLLNLPSTKVAEELNKIVNLEIIDKSVNNVNAKLRESKAKYKVTRESIKEYEEELLKFKDLKEVEKELAYLFRIENEISHLYNNISTLTKCIFSLRSVQDEINNYEKIIQYENTIDNLINDCNELIELQNKEFKLSSIIHKTKNTLRHLAKCRCLVEAQEPLNKIEVMYSELSEYDFVKDLSTVVYKIRKTKEQIKSINNEIKLIEQEYKETMPEICPVCNRPIDHEVYFNSGQSLSI